MNEKNIFPDQLGFTTIYRIYAKTGNYDLALKTLEKQRELMISFNEIHFSALIESLYFLNKLEYFLQNDSEVQNLEKNLIICSELVRVCAHDGNLKFALYVYSKILKESVPLPNSFFGTIFLLPPPRPFFPFFFHNPS